MISFAWQIDAVNSLLEIYNYGNYSRDFTYVDDIVEGVVRVMAKAPERRVGEDGLPDQKNNIKTSPDSNELRFDCYKKYLNYVNNSRFVVIIFLNRRIFCYLCTIETK